MKHQLDQMVNSSVSLITTIQAKLTLHLAIKHTILVNTTTNHILTQHNNISHSNSSQQHIKFYKEILIHSIQLSHIKTF